MLALHELLDPSIFSYGCVQIPPSIKPPLIRDTYGIYRFTYKLNSHNKWEIFAPKRSITSNTDYNAMKKQLKSFFCPNIMPYHYDVSSIDEKRIDSRLKALAESIKSIVLAHKREGFILSELVFEAESCIDMSSDSFIHVLVNAKINAFDSSISSDAVDIEDNNYGKYAEIERAAHAETSSSQHYRRNYRYACVISLLKLNGETFTCYSLINLLDFCRYRA